MVFRIVDKKRFARLCTFSGYALSFEDSGGLGIALSDPARAAIRKVWVSHLVGRWMLQCLEQPLAGLEQFAQECVQSALSWSPGDVSSSNMYSAASCSPGHRPKSSVEIALALPCEP